MTVRAGLSLVIAQVSCREETVRLQEERHTVCCVRFHQEQGWNGFRGGGSQALEYFWKGDRNALYWNSDEIPVDCLHIELFTELTLTVNKRTFFHQRQRVAQTTVDRQKDFALEAQFVAGSDRLLVKGWNVSDLYTQIVLLSITPSQSRVD